MLLRSLVLRYQRASAGSSPESRSAGCGNSLTLSTPSSGQFLGTPGCLRILERGQTVGWRGISLWCSLTAASLVGLSSQRCPRTMVGCSLFSEGWRSGRRCQIWERRQVKDFKAISLKPEVCKRLDVPGETFSWKKETRLIAGLMISVFNGPLKMV